MNGHHLDQAIDQVAKQLTQVDDDPQLASRIVASLPERSTWFGWLTHSWAPRLAMIAIVVGVAALWNSRQTMTELPAVARPVALVALAPPLVPLNVEPLEPVRTKPLEPLEPLEPVEPSEAFTGLPSITAPVALAMTEVAPQALPDTGSLSLPSLVIADLPLTADSFPERD